MSVGRVLVRLIRVFMCFFRMFGGRFVIALLVLRRSFFVRP